MTLVTTEDIKTAILLLEQKHSIKTNFTVGDSPLVADSLAYAFISQEVTKSINNRKLEDIKEQLTSFVSDTKNKIKSFTESGIKD